MTHFPAPLALFDVGAPELMLIFFAVLLLFGGQKLPELAKGLGKSIREFKKASAGVEEEIRRAIETAPDTSSQPRTLPATLPAEIPAPAPLPSPATTDATYPHAPAATTGSAQPIETAPAIDTTIPPRSGQHDGPMP